MELWLRAQDKDSEHMDMALVQRIEELCGLTVAELKTKYREVFGEETRSTHKQISVPPYRLAGPGATGGRVERARH